MRIPLKRMHRRSFSGYLEIFFREGPADGTSAATPSGHRGHAARQRQSASKGRRDFTISRGELGPDRHGVGHLAPIRVGAVQLKPAYRLSVTLTFDSRLRTSRDTQADFSTGVNSAVRCASPAAPWNTLRPSAVATMSPGCRVGSAITSTGVSPVAPLLLQVQPGTRLVR